MLEIKVTIITTMKKTTFLLLGGLLLSPVMGQEATANRTFVSEDYQQCDRFFKTVPLRDMMSIEYVGEAEEQHGKDRLTAADLGEFTDIGIPENNGIDPIRQDWMGERTDMRTLSNWNALAGGFPPDPTGAAGHQYYVQAKNGSYRVYSKEGDNEGGGSLNGIWGTTGDGDPIVMYDRYADRWFISQFGLSGNKIFIAISETSDPTGAYYTYEFSFPNFPDYPKYGVWHDAYYMTANCNPRNNNCIAFEREKMLVGDPTAGKINMSFPFLPVAGFYSVGPAYADGAMAPEDDEPCYFVALQDNSWSGVSSDGLKIYSCELNWDSESGSLSEHEVVDVASFNSIFNPFSFSDLDQLGTSQELDAVEENVMYRVQYRRFANYNVMMVCHTVDADNTNRAAIRWYELREYGDRDWEVHQQGTYDPDDGNHRWMGSISMDAQGNIALAYSFMGPSDYPGLRYTGRFADDPDGVMTVEEQIAVEGAGSQTVTNRYGDYGQMTMDPSDDMTFWMTGEWLGSGGSVRTRVFSFSSWHLVGDEEVQNTAPLFKAFQPTPGLIRLSWIDIEDENLYAEFYSTNGQLMYTQQLDNDVKQKDIPSSNFATGIYVIKLVAGDKQYTRKLYIGQ
ncbi:MAG: T9SS type A sorting domain-containing protein [Crocinitomicaceae bacterium]|nr:T9SS type A sorting domain-containing protein [Crocinitomicaceae bacterium]